MSFKSQVIVRSETDSLADIEAKLEGRVFHVTKQSSWKAIQKTGAILPNSDGKLATSFGSSRNSYFRRLGCVSVFDYREKADHEILGHRSKCRWDLPAEPGSEGIAILFLSPTIWPALLPWCHWKNGDVSQMMVPYVEAGHLGPIPLTTIEEVLLLRIEEDQGSVMAIMRNARRNIPK